MAKKPKAEPQGPDDGGIAVVGVSDDRWRRESTEQLGFQLFIEKKLFKPGAENVGRLFDKLEAGEDFGLEPGVILRMKADVHAFIAANSGADEDDVEDTEVDADESDANSDSAPVGEAPTMPAQIDPTTPEGLIEYDCLTAKLVSDAELAFTGLEAEYEDLHEDAKIAKASFEKARDKMRFLIRSREGGRTKKPQPTVFDKPIEYPESTPSAADNLWQEYPVTFERWGRFGLTEKDVEKLNGGETKNHGTHPIAVLGDMTRFITPDKSNPAYARSVKDFKGFGDGGADRWAEAETKFWAYWNAEGQAEFAGEKGIVTDAAQPGTGSGVPEAVAGTTDDGSDADDSRPLSDAAEQLPDIPEAGRKPKRKARSK